MAETTYRTEEDDAWLAERIAYEEDPEHRIVVDLAPTRWHPVIAPIRKQFRDELKVLEASRRHDERSKKHKYAAREPNFDGWKWRMHVAQGQIFHSNDRVRAAAVRASALTYERALATLSTLCFEAEKRGFSVRHNTEEGRIQLVAHDATVNVRVTERVEKAWRTEKDTWDGKPRSEEYKEPTGILKLAVGFRLRESAITDTADDPIETRLNDAFALAWRYVLHDVVWHRELEAERKRAAEEAARRAAAETRRREEEARRAEEAKRRQGLLEEGSNWKTATVLREYLAHVRASLPAEKTPAAAAWLAWADQVAADLDPMKGRVAALGQPPQSGS